MAASGVADRVLVAGYVPEADKAALLNGADVFAYPEDARYEGFGLPVLEAMACATPVVTTTGVRSPRSPGAPPSWSTPATTPPWPRPSPS